MYIDAVLHLRHEHNLNPEDVAEIVCTVSPSMYHRNFEPENVKYTPPNGYAAVTSIPYIVGAALAEGRLTEAELSDEKVKDPKILKTVRKVSRITDGQFKDYCSASVNIKMKDGRVYQRDQNAVLGTPEVPAPRETIEEKFLSLTEPFLSKTRAREVLDTVAQLEQVDKISDLMRLLRVKERLRAVGS